jgi:hypothetical protein
MSAKPQREERNLANKHNTASTNTRRAATEAVAMYNRYIMKMMKKLFQMGKEERASRRSWFVAISISSDMT